MKFAFDAEKSEMASLDNLENARNNMLHCHDDSMIDSNKDFILMHLKGDYFLISRNEHWKIKLNEDEIQLYEKAGNQAFKAIAKIRQ